METILIEFPDYVETERLLIRAPKLEDWKELHEAVRASKAELEPWLPFARNDETEEDRKANTKEAYVNFISRKDLRFHVYSKETGRFIASTGLHRIDWKARKFEIGYWVDSRQSGQGYVTEVVHGLTKFAFEQLEANRVEIRCDSKNTKSRAVAERAGFDLEGILRNDEIDHKGILRDTCVYSKIKL
ncbi:GNAT family N-acetyltransferase [Oceanobacillus iheyensis]|uniref:GNAT family N-acetyltransferase n=1 Tax=Oceanobacillus iheyensis TaxID=182710 RepID=UPI003634F52D